MIVRRILRALLALGLLTAEQRVQAADTRGRSAGVAFAFTGELRR